MNQHTSGPGARQLVVDASVGIKLFIDEALSEQSHALFAGLTADVPIQLHIPDLFYIECTNILWKYVQRLGLPLETARQNLVDLGKLALVITPTSILSETALEIAVSKNLTAYDACYVALAKRLEARLITADKQIVEAVEEAQWLGDLNV